MFDVRTTSPLDDHWEQRDELLYTLAGGKSDWSGTEMTHDRTQVRVHGWRVSTFQEAINLRKKFAKVKTVHATVNESCTAKR